MMRTLLRCGFLLLLLLTGCTTTDTSPEQQLGQPSPETAVTAFLSDLNLALNDLQIRDDATVRQNWANRLAGHFTPRELADQRSVMLELLNGFVIATASPARGENVEIILTYTRAEVITQSTDTAEVDVIDGLFVVRWRDAEQNVVLERSANLLSLIGRSNQGLPVQRVDGRWYMTEGF
jgi:hypothetical protein